MVHMIYGRPTEERVPGLMIDPSPLQTTPQYAKSNVTGDQ